MGIWDEVQAAVAEAGARVGPATARIGRDWRGAGVVVGEGRVLTNAHNLRGATTTVAFADGRTATGEVAAADGDADLAVVRVDTGGVAAPPWAEGAAEVGMPVLAVAHGSRGLRVTMGFVSAVDQPFRGPRGRRIRGGVEHTAPLARGSSGGPLLDLAGRLLGVNTHRLGDGFYLALPADDDLRRRVGSLAEGEAPRRPRLGVGLAPAGVARALRRSVGLPERDGLLVRAVEEGSPAHAAGLRQGDLVVVAGGRPVAAADDLYEILDGLAAGAPLDLVVVRGVDEVAVTVAFAAPDVA